MTKEQIQAVSEDRKKKYTKIRYLKVFTTSLVLSIVPTIFGVTAYADAGTDAMASIISLLETYVPIIGGAVAFIGILMFAQSMASQDAERKAQAGFVVAAGGMIAAAGGFAGTLMGGAGGGGGG
jgi:hypothetical protein